MSLIELMIVLAVSAIMVGFAIPNVFMSRDSSARRAARQELAAAFAATRAAALQKGKLATLTLTSNSATVSVMSGMAGSAVVVLGPVRFNTSLMALIDPLDGAPSTIQYNARGMMTPTPVSTQRYQVTVGMLKDTVCISPAGIILPKGCAL